MLVKARKGTRKLEILSKATELFRQKGYAATSMRDLAQAMGIEAASLYSHIKSKEQLLQNICFRMADTFFQAQEATANDSLDSLQQLENAMVTHVSVITKDTAASAVFFNEWRHLSEEPLTRFKELRHNYEAHFRAILEKGMDNNEIRRQSASFTTLTLFSAMNVIYTWYKPEGSKSPEEIGREIARLLIYGLKN